MPSGGDPLRRDLRVAAAADALRDRATDEAAALGIAPMAELPGWAQPVRPPRYAVAARCAVRMGCSARRARRTWTATPPARDR